MHTALANETIVIIIIFELTYRDLLFAYSPEPPFTLLRTQNMHRKRNKCDNMQNTPVLLSRHRLMNSRRETRFSRSLLRWRGSAEKKVDAPLRHFVSFLQLAFLSSRSPKSACLPPATAFAAPYPRWTLNAIFDPMWWLCVTCAPATRTKRTARLHKYRCGFVPRTAAACARLSAACVARKRHQALANGCAFVVDDALPRRTHHSFP